ncbi:serine hydrolase domain-containing protein [Actinoplanes aureus]|uniref:Beta-lactamase family protein n=1 Tax=Actinoplanes aureus TaxID=2792083 RepID=A0A931G842_9ACTN|nr:serine hydrolase domain-containing protein [Actinoplanes aureus]MBG0568874.1 beta-lactamase family protein [Actinoplanes aureus]
MRRHLARWGLATALAATVIAGTAIPAAATNRPLQTAADDLHRLGITGVQALARVDGVTARARAGVGDLKRGTPVPLDGYFRMGSNTKTYVAVTVLQLVGEGRLSLDDTVDRWLPGVVAGNGNDGRKITVRQVLQHTSGVFNYTNDMAALTSEEGFRAHRFDHYDPADLVAIAMKHEPGFAPGTHWDYSNTNYILAGMIIEEVTGRPWDVEVRDRILRPLGLRRTSAPGDRPWVPNPHAKGYQQWEPGGELSDTTVWNTSGAGAAGNLITTPSDLARFWQALQRGRLLKPQQMAQLQSTVLAETFQDYLPGARYGLGVMFVPNRCGGYWAHGGDVPGMSTANGVSPDGDRVAVVSLSTQLADEKAVFAVHERTMRLIDDAICAGVR